MNTTLAVTNVTKKYLRDNKLFTAVDDLTFNVAKGQVLGFLGPNGAGKTTSIKMICGLISPTSGSILVNDYDIRTDYYNVMRSIGAVLEGTRNIYWHMTALQNLIYFGRLKQQWGRSLSIRANYLLKEFGLYEVRNERVGRFSRGMQQKVAIACALIHDPQVILLDEPTLGLDHEASEILKAWIRKLAHEQNKTIILTTHQLDIAEELCDRIIVINKGKVLVDMPLEELKNIVHTTQEIQYTITLDTALHQPPALLRHAQVSKEDHRTTYTVTLTHEKELKPLFNYIAEHEIPLVRIERIEQQLEDVFVHLTKKT